MGVAGGAQHGVPGSCLPTPAKVGVVRPQRPLPPQSCFLVRQPLGVATLGPLCSQVSRGQTNGRSLGCRLQEVSSGQGGVCVAVSSSPGWNAEVADGAGAAFVYYGERVSITRW